MLAHVPTRRLPRICPRGLKAILCFKDSESCQRQGGALFSRMASVFGGFWGGGLGLRVEGGLGFWAEGLRFRVLAVKQATTY